MIKDAVRIVLVRIAKDRKTSLAHILGAVVKAMQTDGTEDEREIANAIDAVVHRVGEQIAKRKAH